VPTLRPGEVVVLDNLVVHKQPAVCAAIEAVGAQLRFLPPYSPDFNPIEQVFVKLKAFLRAARPRSFDEVTTLMAIALGLFTATECANYIRPADIAPLYRCEKRSSVFHNRTSGDSVAGVPDIVPALVRREERQGNSYEGENLIK